MPTNSIQRRLFLRLAAVSAAPYRHPAAARRAGLMRSCMAATLFTGASLLASCSTDVRNGRADAGVQPGSTPIGTVTTFTEALSCMDDMLLRENYGTGTPISSAGIQDATGKINVGGRDMLIHAISLMSRRSEVFHYIDLDQKNLEAGKPAAFGQGLFIRGTISELNNNVVSKDEGIGVGTHSIYVSNADQQMANVIAVDMSMEEATTRQIIPSTSTSNTLTLVRRDKGLNFDGHIGSPGLSFTYSDDTAEGEARGARTLIELTTIEMVGKYFKVPYWECLGVANTDPRAVGLANEHYLDLKPEERTAFDLKGLRAAGYYHGPDVTTWTAELRTAAAKYQQDHSAVPTGLETFDLFFALMKDPAAGDNFGSLKAAAKEVPTPNAQLPQSSQPLVHVSVDGAEEPGSTKFYAGAPLTFEVGLTSAGYLACFYEDAEHAVFRVYPTPTQPSAVIPRASRVTIPSAQDDFRIRPSVQNSQEKFGCYASSEPLLSRLPDAVGAAALEPLPVASIDAIEQILIQQLGNNLAHDRANYKVGIAAP